MAVLSGFNDDGFSTDEGTWYSGKAVRPNIYRGLWAVGTGGSGHRGQWAPGAICYWGAVAHLWATRAEVENPS